MAKRKPEGNKRPRGRPPKAMPELKPRPDGEEITAENLAQAFLRLPPDYEWQYLKDSGGIENGEAS